MTERTALGEQILKHWRDHCPQMVRDLEKMNRLDQAVFETQERVGDLLYDLTTVRKMDYQAAWEMAREEWATPPGEGSPKETPSSPPKSSNRSKPRRSRRATSGSRKRTGSAKAG
jgi:hypothetical protein